MEFYRYEIVNYAEGKDIDGEYISSNIPNPKVELRTYSMIKETPKGYWIGFRTSYFLNWKKWIPKVSRKRFAYPTKEEALNNFIKRTEKRIKIIKYQKWNCEIALDIAKNIKL